jgi:hypothetical protein
VEDADEAVAELTQRGVVAGAARSRRVVVSTAPGEALSASLAGSRCE